MKKQKHFLYRRWLAMNARCKNVSHPKYKNYGGRGIRVKWGSFEDFKKDMLSEYKPGLTLDRVNVDGDYSKENCRWATQKQQNNNRTNNFYVTYSGERKTLAQWSRFLNIRYGTLFNRLRSGFSVEEACGFPTGSLPRKKRSRPR